MRCKGVCTEPCATVQLGFWQPFGTPEASLKAKSRNVGSWEIGGRSPSPGNPFKFWVLFVAQYSPRAARPHWPRAVTSGPGPPHRPRGGRKLQGLGGSLDWLTCFVTFLGEGVVGFLIRRHLSGNVGGAQNSIQKELAD